MRCLALDIGGTKIAAALVKDGNVTERRQFKTPQDESAEGMHGMLADIIHSYIDQSNIASRKVLTNNGFAHQAFKDFDGLPGEILALTFANATAATS